MRNRDTLVKEISLVKSLGLLVTTYEELTVMRIQRVRDSVLSTRTFHEGLSRVFASVRETHKKEIEKLMKAKKKRWLFFRSGEEEEIKKKRPKAVILISTNKRLSGNITMDVFKHFLRYIEEHNPKDIIISGSVGRDLFTKVKPGHNFTYFDMPEKPNSNNLKELITHIQTYDDLLIFFGHFVNLVEQLPATTDLSEEMVAESSAPKQKQRKKEDASFLFEPSLKEAVHFFDTEIFAMLFRQTVNESELAQLGSRITAMEKASHNVEKKLHTLVLEDRQVKRKEYNEKQRQRMSGISLWNT